MSGARAPISGADVQAFVEAWPPGEGWVHEESSVPDALFDLEDAEPTKLYTYEQLGLLVPEGKGAPEHATVATGQWIRNWLDNRAYVTVVVTVPRERADALRLALREFGATCFEPSTSHTTTRHDQVAIDFG